MDTTNLDIDTTNIVLLDEINKNTTKFKMPRWWFETSVKVIAPVCLVLLFSWQIYVLAKDGFRYDDKHYNLAAEIIAGWVVTALVFASGFIIKLIVHKTKQGQTILELEKAEPTWDEITDNEIADDNSNTDTVEIEEA